MGAVTTSLNQLLARLDHTIQQERLFTADAAHELRTPLAGIRLHLELMAQAGSAQAKTLISRIDQLMHTVEQLLMLARAGQALASGHYDTLVWTENIIAPLGLEHEAKEHKVIWPEEKSPDRAGRCRSVASDAQEPAGECCTLQPNRNDDYCQNHTARRWYSGKCYRSGAWY